MRNLSKRFGRLEVLRGVDLEVPAGAVQSLVGLNGAGKTTTIECVLGLQRFDGGEASVLGAPPRRIWETAGRVGAVFDSPCLQPWLTVRQCLRHAALLAGRRSRPPEEVESLLGLERFRAVRVRRLSLGNRRRAAIAHALIGRPELVVLDEPFSGLDAGGVDGLLALIGTLNREDGTTFLLASHQLPYLERVSTHVGILHGGRIARAGLTRELLESGGTRLRVRVGERGGAAAFLRGLDGVRGVEEAPDGSLAVRLDGAAPAAVNRALIEAGFEVSELAGVTAGLDAVFRDVVGRDG